MPKRVHGMMPLAPPATTLSTVPDQFPMRTLDADRTDLLELTRTIASRDARGGAAEPIARGTCFGRYLVLDAIGRGGMGVVYLAEQLEPVRRTVAIKVIPQGRLSPQHCVRFDIERQALARMNHPGIAQILDAGTTPEDQPWFVMEHVEGLPLDRWLATDKPDLKQRIALLRDVARAVAHAHQRGLLHCDLKPSNILITQVDDKPFAKLIDFGIARTLGARGEGSSAGTPSYMSPEQCVEGAELDTRSDVFSLGVLLFELISGRRYRAWQTEQPLTLAEAGRRVAAERPREPSAAGGQRLPRASELDAIVLKAVAPEREQRYSSADALADDIDRWLALLPVEALPARPSYRLRCFLRRHKAVSAALLLGLAVAAGLLWRLFDQLAETRRERDSAEQITGLLLETFRAADPYSHPGGSITARELLRSSADGIRAQALDSEVRLRVLESLGEVQHRLQLHEDAAQTFSQALGLMGESAARQPRGIAMMHAHANAVMDAEHFERALTMSGTLIESARHHGQPGQLCNALLLRAQVLEYLERYDDAQATLAEAEVELTRHPDRELRQRFLRLRGRIASYWRVGDIGIADLQEALALADAIWGEQDLRTVDTLSDLALAESFAGRMAASEQNRRRVAQLTERIWGEDSPDLAVALDNLAVHLTRMGGEERLSEAEPLTRRALGILQARLGPDSMTTGATANNLANVLAARNRHEQALEAYAAALQGMVASLGEDHSRVGIVRHNLGRSLMALGRLDEAGVQLSQSEAILRERLGSDDPRYSIWRTTQAGLHLARSEIDQARRLLDEAEPVLLGAFEESSPQVGRLRDLQAKL